MPRVDAGFGRLIADGLMTAAGMVKIEAAKRDGSRAAYDASEDLQVPEDLTAALAKNVTAQLHFRAFSNSSKKQILWWIESAKRPETRATRIEWIVAAEENTNPLTYAAARRRSAVSRSLAPPVAPAAPRRHGSPRSTAGVRGRRGVVSRL